MISTLQLLSSLETILTTHEDKAKCISEALAFIAVSTTHFQTKIDICEYGRYRGKSFKRILDFDREWLIKFARDRRIHPDVRRHISNLLREHTPCDPKGEQGPLLLEKSIT